MTLAELAATLPNGFHDGKLLSVHFDIFSRRLTLSVNLWVGTLASDSEEEREKYQRASISLRGLSHIIVDEMDTTLAASDFWRLGHRWSSDFCHHSSIVPSACAQSV